MAIDPNCFSPGFAERLSDLNRIHRDLKPSPNAPGQVLVAGDPERINMRASDEANGIKEMFKNNDFPVVLKNQRIYLCCLQITVYFEIKKVPL